jgi:hypothetical protein
MKRATILLIAFYLATSCVIAQTYEPQILILTPNETKYDEKFEKEIAQINNDIKKSSKATEQQQYIKSKEFENEPENIRLMTLSEVRFSENMDFFGQTSYFAHQYLSYKFFERFTNLLILLSNHKTKGELSDLKSIADKEHIQYVLNFPRIELYRDSGIGYAKIAVQLYDNQTGEYLINKEFVGDWLNPGFEFSCKDETVQCTINNALSTTLSTVIKVIATNSPTLKRERQLFKQRYDELVTNHLSKPFDITSLKTIIQQTGSELPLDNIYQILYDESKTKFVAFSVQQVSAQDFKTLKDNNKDKNINIISSKDIKDKDFLQDVPRTYAFIIKGVKYNDKWYYEKANATYFEAASVDEGRREYFNNLQKWNFFIENTTMVNPDFWETSLFEKVRDLKQDPDWEKYGESMWETEEANNRGYVGLYKIVANVIKQSKRQENEKFEKDIERKLKLAYDRLKNTDPKAFSKYSEHSLIYPSDRSVIINPVLVTNDKNINTLRYFVIFSNSNEVFEWTYFPSEKVKSSGFFGSNVVDRMNTITEWNFSYENLDDKNFWNKYVLFREGNKFKYLNKVQM